MAGPLLETHVFGQILRHFRHRAMEVDIHHWRTRDGQELDFLVEAGGRIYPVEVKAGLPDARDLVRLERVGDAQWQGGTVLSLVPSEPYALAAGWTARHVTDLSFLRG